MIADFSTKIIKAPDTKSANVKTSDTREKETLVKEGGSCGLLENKLCEHGLICALKSTKKCRPVGLIIKRGQKKAPCKADKTCNKGLSCSTLRSKNGAKRNICVRSPVQRDPCETSKASTPCGNGYECVIGALRRKEDGFCNAEGYISISGRYDFCGEKAPAECGPGLECVTDPKTQQQYCDSIPLKFPDGDDLPKEGTKCRGEFGKKGVCATGLVCVLNVNDIKNTREGVCKPFGLQNDECETENGYEKPCAEGYECVSNGPKFGLKSKFCMKESHKFIAYKNFDGCGPETRNFCAPDFNCIESQAKYPGVKICLRKGDKEVHTIE